MEIRAYYDIFYKNDKIYLILPLFKIQPEITLFFKNKVIEVTEKIIKDSWEGVMIYIYDFKENDPLITMKIDNDQINVQLHNIKTVKNKKLTLTTLFKDNYKLIDTFYDYYTKQGVEHFYLYYNGKLTEEIKNKFLKDNITLIEWDYVYHTHLTKTSVHYAQPGQMHHAIYRYGKDCCEHMIFCDFDEYLTVKDKLLIDMVQEYNDVDTFGFNQILSKVVMDENIELQLEKLYVSFPKIFYISSVKCEYGFKNYKDFTLKPPCSSKCIHKMDTTSLINIHAHANENNNVLLLPNFNFYHFYNKYDLWNEHFPEMTWSLNFVSCYNLGKYGRLGNSMFQYAALLSLASYLNCTPFISTTLNDNLHHGQKCLLDCFKITCERNDIVGNTYSEQVKGGYYDPQFWNCQPGTDVFGFFECELYFDHIKEKIKKEFELKDIYQNWATNCLNNIKPVGYEIVGVHVRLGDATEQNEITTTLQFLINYLNDALKYFNNCAFLVFSGGSQKMGNDNKQDITWCKENLSHLFKGPFFFSENDTIHDFALMTNCDHLILNSTSTIGWWAGYLIKNKNKKILVPHKKRLVGSAFIKGEHYYSRDFITV